MISEKKAKKIETALKEFFWQGASMKSANKAYLVPKDPNVRKEDVDSFDFSVTANDVWSMNWENGKEQMKMWRRFQKTATAAELAAKQGQAPGGKTFWAWGQAAYHAQTPPEQKWGNCAEMAAIAGVIAHEKCHVDKDWIYIAKMMPPADHAFCVISNPRPTWTRVDQLTDGAQPDQAYVLDLWLDTFCLARCFFSLAQKHLEQWAGKNKRIAWTSPTTGAPGWFFPTGTYKNAFDNAALTIVPIDS